MLNCILIDAYYILIDAYYMLIVYLLDAYTIILCIHNMI